MVEKYSKFKRREVCQIAYKDHFKNSKISFDLDSNRPSIKTLRKIVNLIFNGADVYIISDKTDLDSKDRLINNLGIKKNNVYKPRK